MEEVNMSFFYELEYSRIPKVFQVDRFKRKRVFKVLACLGILEIILLAILPWTQKIKDTGLSIGTNEIPVQVAVYSVPLAIACAVVFAVIFVILAWMAISIEFEKSAYRKAATMNAKYQFEQQARIREMHDINRMHSDF